LFPRERTLQAESLVGPGWLNLASRAELGSAGAACGPVVLCGDFNALPKSPVCQTLMRFLEDAQEKMDNHRPKSTWFGRFPFGRIDHVFVHPSVGVERVLVPRTYLTRAASDHLPLVVDLRMP
ncbi:MAG: endonuclease/exonuclease/phosphatase family protein, partial [Candidatus Sumerlaeota bacterium]|nr:endonuclease/exonuclease/phosphatase family protein [Candidatus Sumerlaeota bacterium]